LAKIYSQRIILLLALVIFGNWWLWCCTEECDSELYLQILHLLVSSLRRDYRTQLRHSRWLGELGILHTHLLGGGATGSKWRKYYLDCWWCPERVYMVVWIFIGARCRLGRTWIKISRAWVPLRVIQDKVAGVPLARLHDWVWSIILHLPEEIWIWNHPLPWTHRHRYSTIAPHADNDGKLVAMSLSDILINSQVYIRPRTYGYERQRLRVSYFTRCSKLKRFIRIGVGLDLGDCQVLESLVGPEMSFLCG
jgi:hypothetical protein